MIGTGALSPNLIKAHASVRPIEQVLIWGRNKDKAKALAESLSEENFEIQVVSTVEEGLSEADIISCATLSETPLVLGEHLQRGQHVDLVGAYRPDMREADDAVIEKASIYLDSFEGGLKESGDIVIPIQTGILKKEDIKGDLFSLSSGQSTGRTSSEEITLFKSVGHALEDLVAANYYYEKFTNG